MPRVLVGELMDDPKLDVGDHAEALVGLARLNRLSGAAKALYPALRNEARRLAHPLTILDIATGSADLPVALGRWAMHDGLTFDFTLCDISKTALMLAELRAEDRGVRATVHRLDALRDPLPRADVVLCSLFLHHLTDDQVRLVLGKMATAAERMVLVSDLRRGPWGTTLAAFIPRLVTRSHVVHVDALRSARAALSMAEIRAMTRGIAEDGTWSVAPAFPARMLIRWTPRESSTRS